MEKLSRVLLRLHSLTFEPPGQWWKERDPIGALFACVRESNLWLGFDHVVADHMRPKWFQSEKMLVEFIIKNAPGRYVIQEGKTEDPDGYIMLVLKSSWMQIRFSIGGRALDDLRDTLLDHLIALTTRIHAHFHETALLGPWLGIEIFEPEFPRVRPPREKGIWTYGDAVDFLCRRFHRQAASGRPDEVRRILAAPMPAGTKRTDVGDLVVFRWVDTLSDGEHIAQRCALQEQWLVDVLDPPISSDYNTAGDRLEVPVSVESRPPLTFYDTFSQAGYKALALAPDGSADEELFDEMAGWINSRQLPDGTPLQQLNLILPNRESALRVRDRASGIGAGGVYYTDNDGRWWNPFPPGLWRE